MIAKIISTQLSRSFNALVSSIIEPITEKKLTDAQKLGLTKTVATLASDEIDKIIAEVTEPPQPMPPEYTDLFDFVAWLSKLYGTAEGHEANWSPQWYTHPEAIVRLYAVWESYEQLRRQNQGANFMQKFLHTVGDYHMDRLMRPDSVFAACKQRDTPTEPLPTHPPTQEGL